MKVLHVGNGNYNHHGRKYYDVGRKLNNGFVRNGHNVYFLSDRDSARSANIFRSSVLGRKRVNNIFIDTCYNFEPDLVLFGHADIITSASIVKAKELLPAAKFAQYNVDPVFRPHNISMLQSKAPLLDATFCTTGGIALRKFAIANNIVAFIPNPVDRSIEVLRGFENSDQSNDIFWSMRGHKGSYAGDPRVEIPLFLENNQIKIDYHGFNNKPEVFGARYFKLLANAKMGLNISVTCTYNPNENITKEQIFLYSSDRIAQFMGCGLLVFTTRDNALEELFVEDKELIFFSDKDELKEKITYYAKHDGVRKAIAKAGWEKYHNCFNESVIARYMAEVVFRQTHSCQYQWPTTLFRAQ